MERGPRVYQRSDHPVGGQSQTRVPTHSRFSPLVFINTRELVTSAAAARRRRRLLPRSLSSLVHPTLAKLSLSVYTREEEPELSGGQSSLTCWYIVQAEHPTASQPQGVDSESRNGKGGRGEKRGEEEEDRFLAGLTRKNSIRLGGKKKPSHHLLLL